MFSSRQLSSLTLGALFVFPTKLSAQSVERQEKFSLYDQAVARAKLPDDSKRVSGGGRVSFSDNKWQAALLVADIKNTLRAQFCGGIVVDESWILTAAHCIDTKKTPAGYEVLVGTSTLEADCCRLPVLDYKIHPNYKPNRNDGVSPHDNDIALIKVETSKKDIKDYKIGLFEYDSPIGKEMRATGWGVTERRYSPTINLVGIVVPIIDNNTCNLKKSYDSTVTKNMFCAGDELNIKDTCKGDSGGPATIDYNGSRFLIGITSWGDGCGKLFKFGVYTRVYNFRNWINSIIAKK